MNISCWLKFKYKSFIDRWLTSKKESKNIAYSVNIPYSLVTPGEWYHLTCTFKPQDTLKECVVDEIYLKRMTDNDIK